MKLIYMNLYDLQDEQHQWASRNFPNSTADEALFGVGEEVGELMHAHLKHKQKIRGCQNTKETIEKKKDAIGDILIYLAHYCNLSGIDMQEALEKTWEEVKKRDWIRFPKNGTTE